MSKIVLLGDSIRMNYTEAVTEELGGGFNVAAPQVNGCYAKHTLRCMLDWRDLLQGAEVIHFNNGLWDVAVYYPEDGCFTPLDEYLRDMQRILRELRKYGAKIIFATTTPVDDRHMQKTFTRSNADIDRYNSALLELIAGKVDAVNDLNALLKKDIHRYISGSDFVHLTDEGKAACGKAVADAVRGLVD